MGWAFNPWAVTGFVAAALNVTLALTLYLAAPTRRVAPRLALVLFVDGVLMAAWSAMLCQTEPVGTIRARGVMVAAALLLPSLYLHFLEVLETPLVAPLRTLGGRTFMVTLALGLLAWFAWRPSGFIPEPAREWYGWDTRLGPDYVAYGYLALGVLLFALVASYAARRAATRPSQRRRAHAFLVAFATRDLLYLLLVLIVVVLPLPPTGPLDVLNDLTALLLFPMIPLVFGPLIAYGILRAHLFDLDLKIKWTIRRGTLAGLYVAFFVVAARLVEAYTQVAFAGYSWAISGLLTGFLLLGVVPLERWASRLADRAMPHVSASPAYVLYRKMEVYREALEGLWGDGELSGKERETLERLRTKLGIAAPDAAALEAEVLAARPTVEGRPATGRVGA